MLGQRKIHFEELLPAFCRRSQWRCPAVGWWWSSAYSTLHGCSACASSCTRNQGLERWEWGKCLGRLQDQKGCLKTWRLFVCESSFYFVKCKHGKRRIRRVNGDACLKNCFCSAWMQLHSVNPSKPQRTFENLIPVSLFPFLKSDCKSATRILLNDSPRSDVCAVNHGEISHW